MQYLVTLASDLAKLIVFIKDLKCLDLKHFFSQEVANMPEFCLEFFTTLVVNEAGPVAKNAINFFKECLLDLLSPDEKNTFTCSIISKFLSTPISHVS
jgi:hypothetical protein